MTTPTSPPATAPTSRSFFDLLLESAGESDSHIVRPNLFEGSLQTLQLGWCAWSWYWPTGHFLAGALPPAQKCPGWQSNLPVLRVVKSAVAVTTYALQTPTCNATTNCSISAGRPVGWWLNWSVGCREKREAPIQPLCAHTCVVWACLPRTQAGFWCILSTSRWNTRHPCTACNTIEIRSLGMFQRGTPSY